VQVSIDGIGMSTQDQCYLDRTQAGVVEQDCICAAALLRGLGFGKHFVDLPEFSRRLNRPGNPGDKLA